MEKGAPRLDQRLRDFADIAELTLDDPNDAGASITTSRRCTTPNQRGLLDRAVRPATLAKLKQQLDGAASWGRSHADRSAQQLLWRGLPIARLRHLMGWEDAPPADQLLARTLDHYRRYSGEFGFADETEGKGRFDRYSVLLIGEIAKRLIETGMTPSAEVKRVAAQVGRSAAPAF
ncbi:hypothetical protein DdX_22039 [Ditylenchus destructor]|uniref:Uncharacterized protein n=1 Tax=Ditylenchus destructor TaxID=166010 RepID=A0AAD4QSQ9_9BILA|nr:hypothetical protein DdX_22039 [Ditylenchus destructor]